MRWSAKIVACLLGGALCVGGGERTPAVRMLVPGFTVRELPVSLPNINNLAFAPDGRLTAVGYDGRVWLLRDSDGDGLEDTVEPFWDKPTISVPVGMAWSTAGLYISSHGKVSLLGDRNGDGRADIEEVIAAGWPPTDVGSGGVDATGVTLDHDGNVYFGLITADYSNPYRVKGGVSHYDLGGLRGTIQKWYAKTRTLETVATGIRVPFALKFNAAGDLFCTDQEGATWCPNGNPLDELDHILPGRNYGFPPRDEKWLPNLVSEPPVVAFGPQHQSTCGLVFNEPRAPLNAKGAARNPQPKAQTPAPALPAAPAQGLFGPRWWKGDAFIAGESRGKIWRVRLVKTPHGYVGRQFLIARLSMLTLDLAISPKGDLYVCCHSGVPDWGTGPRGAGKIFKISYSDPAAPQPVIAWAAKPTEVRVTFDRPVDPTVTNRVGDMRIVSGEYVRAADRYEFLKPPYEAVKAQEATPRWDLKVIAVRLDRGGKTLVLTTPPQALAVHYALTIPGVKPPGRPGPGATVDVDYDLSGIEVKVLKGQYSTESPGHRQVEVPNSLTHWVDRRPQAARPALPLISIDWQGWLPSADPRVAKELLRGSGEFEAFTAARQRNPGRPVLISAIYRPPVRDARLRVDSRQGFMFIQGRQPLISATNPPGHGSLTLPARGFAEGRPFTLRGNGRFDLTYTSATDPTVRPVGLADLVVPWASVRPPAIPLPQTEPALAGGDYENGRALFFGDRLKCSICHTIHGQGGHIGPDLGILTHRDAASVLRDIKEPSASINPDFVAYNAHLKGGGGITGFIREQGSDSLTMVGADGKAVIVPRASLEELRVSSLSLMPSGLLDGLAPAQVRDLLTFLVNDPPRTAVSPHH